MDYSEMELKALLGKFTYEELERLAKTEEEFAILDAIDELGKVSKKKKPLRASKVNVTYRDRQKIGRLGEEKVMKYLARRNDTNALRDVSKNSAFFNGDIDILWYTKKVGNLFACDVNELERGVDVLNLQRAEKKGRRVRVEVKVTNTPMHAKSACFTFQTVSNLSTGLEGWVYRTEADVLAIVHMGARTMYTLGVSQLQEYLKELEREMGNSGNYQGVIRRDIDQRDGDKIICKNRCLFVPRTLIESLDSKILDYSVIRLE